MSSALLERPIEIPVAETQTPFYGGEAAGGRNAPWRPEGSAWDRALTGCLPSLPARTRTLSQREVEQGIPERDSLLAAVVLGVAVAFLYWQFKAPLFPADPPHVGASGAQDSTTWWEKPGIGPMGLDLLAQQPSPSQANAAPSRALAAADDLRAWLGITYEDLGRMTDIGKTTFHHWKRTNAAPRPATVERLRRVHALVRAVIAGLSREDAGTWFRTGTPSPLDLLLAGNLEGAERLAHRVLFSGSRPEGRSYAAFAPYDPETDIEVQPLPSGPRPGQPLKPQRIRLTTR